MKNISSKKRIVTCADCIHAQLLQYDAPREPLLAQCHDKPQPGNLRFPYQVEVARCLRLCPSWKHDESEKVIEHRIKHVGISVA